MWLCVSRLQVDNPYTGEIFCEVAYDSKAEAHAKLDAAVKAQRDWKNVPLHQRQALCTQWVSALASNAESIAQEISGMMGKPVQQARNEVNGTIERAKYDKDAPQEILLDVANTLHGVFCNAVGLLFTFRMKRCARIRFQKRIDSSARSHTILLASFTSSYVLV